MTRVLSLIGESRLKRDQICFSVLLIRYLSAVLGCNTKRYLAPATPLHDVLILFVFWNVDRDAVLSVLIRA